MIDIERVMEKSGGVGRCQIILIIMAGYNGLLMGWTDMAPIFLNFVPEFRCKVPSANISLNLTESELLSLNYPYNNNEYSSCERFDYNLDDCLKNITYCLKNKTRKAINCDIGYEYDDSVYTQSIATEFNLVCNNSFYNSLSILIFMLGYMVASLTTANVPDRWGRKKFMNLSMIACFVLSMLCGFIHNYWAFSILRFGIYFCSYGIFLSSYVYVVELSNTKWRTAISLYYHIIFGVGHMLLSLLAYYWRYWNHLQIAMAILCIPSILLNFLLPESPRWLFANSMDEEGKKIIRKMAYYNGVKINEPEIWQEAECQDDLDTKENSKQEEKIERFPFLVCFRSKNIRIITLILLVNWFAIATAFFGISFNAAALNVGVYTSNLLFGAVDIVANGLVIFLLDRTGRKYLLICFSLASGCFLLLGMTFFIYEGQNEIYSKIGDACYFIGKFIISGSYSIIFQYTSELYPTVIRSTAVGLGTVMEGVSGLSFPFILYLHNYASWLPSLIMGIALIVSALMMFKLPETKGKPMLQTIAEANLFYAGKSDINNKVNANDAEVSISSDRNDPVESALLVNSEDC